MGKLKVCVLQYSCKAEANVGIFRGIPAGLAKSGNIRSITLLSLNLQYSLIVALWVNITLTKEKPEM
jgi:hypothetical protein